MQFESFLNETTNPKYPRTFHLPWSEEVHSDDKTLLDVSHLIGKPLTITIKMDGSNVGLSSSFNDFAKSTAKYVRKGHVQPDKHWMYQEIKVNKVK